MHFEEALRKSAVKLEADLEISKLIAHNASKGVFREYIIKSVIRPFLPKRYGISSGECFDLNGKTSKQLDVVIYDDLYSYTIPYGEYTIFPYESIYGNIEVKSYLGKNEFMQAIDNIVSMKELYRDKPEPCQIIPSLALNIEGVNWNSNRKKNPFGIIFAYDSAKADTVLRYFNENRLQDKTLYPDMIVLFSEKTIICRIKYFEPPKFYPTCEDDFDAFMTLPCDENTLPILISYLLTVTSDMDLKLMNITGLMNKMIDESLKNMGTQGVIYII